MRAHPTLNLNVVTPDPELVGQVPHAMALYYLALPLAREDGLVSVAMAHPENTTALVTLSRLLGGPVVPVRGAAGAIRAALHTLRPSQYRPASGILGWSARPEWAAAVAEWTGTLATVLGAPATVLVPAQATLDDYPTAVLAEPHRLIVLGLSSHSSPADVLGRAAGPLFLVRGAEVRPLSRILVALRGFSSDEPALDWAVLLAQGTNATLTLMPLTGQRGTALQEVLAAMGTSGQQFRTCGGRPNPGDLRTTLKVRQGHPVRQIGDEAAEGRYDLILISAEGEGEFVGHALAELDRRSVHTGRPVLILKPTV